MGHEGFYKFLLAAMGNVVSALLMYALQAAWLCQRLIDQDYRQNHGSRLTPVAENKDKKKPIEIVSSQTDYAFSRTGHHRTRHHRQGSKTRRQMEKIKAESWRSQRSPGDSKRSNNSSKWVKTSKPKLHLSHPYLVKATNALAIDYLNGLVQVPGIRKAFSDINLSSRASCELFDDEESRRKISDCLVDASARQRGDVPSMPDKQRLIEFTCTKGYVT